MSARKLLQLMIRTDRGSMTVWSKSEVASALDAYRAEVLRESADEIERQQAIEEAEERDRFGFLDHESEICRGAVRDKAEWLRRLADGEKSSREADATSDFFHPGRAYAARRHADLRFECLALSAGPDTGERKAIGWRYGPPHNGVRPHRLAALGADDWACCDWTETTNSATTRKDGAP